MHPSARSRAGAVLLLSTALALFSLLPPSPPERPTLPAGAGPSYLFLSPNTDEQLSPAEAARRLASPGQARFRRVATAILDGVGVAGYCPLDALGDWSDGAENAILIEVRHCAEPRALEYAAAWFGLLAEQKMVLVFHPQPRGPDTVTVLDVPEGDLAALRAALDRHGIAYRTLVRTAAGYRVVLFDRGQPGEQVARLAAFYGVHPQTAQGAGTWFGEQTRPLAQQRYREEIRRYEDQPRRRRFRPDHVPVLALQETR